MNKVTIFLSSLTLFGFLSVQADETFRADQNFGGDMPLEGEAITLKEAIADLNQGSEGFVKILADIFFVKSFAIKQSGK